MREIILDTETTGLRSNGDDRIIEIGCLEVINKKITGDTFHVYINPEREVPFAATKVHNITTEFLQDKPFFKDVADGFINFIQDSPLVIHNAPFDMGFINAEFKRLSIEALPSNRAIDTLSIARQKFPGSNNTLDGLCKRFRIDLSNRRFHGALIDCELLYQVYIELMGGRQGTFSFGSKKEAISSFNAKKIQRQTREKRVFLPKDDEQLEHDAFINELKDPLWKKL